MRDSRLVEDWIDGLVELAIGAGEGGEVPQLVEVAGDEENEFGGKIGNRWHRTERSGVGEGPGANRRRRTLDKKTNEETGATTSYLTLG